MAGTVKAFTERFYRNICGAELAPVLDTLEYVKRATQTWLEITTLLIPGRNDGDDELEALERLLRGQYAVMNFIPYNSVEGMPWRRPGLERAREMARYLHSRGILTKLRRSAGQDVDGGCGQLRARAAHLRTSRRKGGDDKQG